MQQSCTDLCVTVQLYSLSLPAAGWADWFMVGDNKRQDLAKLEASLAPAEAEVGAMAKADQYEYVYFRVATGHSLFTFSL